MTNLKPLGSNVIVKPIEAETVTSSGIIIPDTANKEKPMRGTVIALPPLPHVDHDNYATLSALSEGDTVFFTKYAPTEVKIKGDEYYIMDAKSVLAIVVSE
jgi:chaperonin GroES